MSRHPNRSAVLGERGPKECERLSLPPRQLRELMDPSRETTAALPSPFAPIVESALPDWRDCESIRAEFEAREAAGGRPRDERASAVAQRSCKHPMRW